MNSVRLRGLLRIAIGSALVTVLWSGPLLAAKQVKSVVRKDTRELVGYDYEWDQTCRPLPRPRPIVIEPPRNGRVTFSNGSGTMLDDKSSQCRGARSNSVGVFYTPKRGYTGPDVFKIRWTYTIIAPQIDTFQLDVR